MNRCIVGLVALYLGCSVRPCDEDQTIDQNGFCVMNPSGGAAGTTSNGPGGASDPGTAGGDAGAPACSQASAFGDACDTNSDCHCDVNYCAVNPGSTSGVCTRTGCVEDPGICPDKWMCLDLSVFSSELPAICVPN